MTSAPLQLTDAPQRDDNTVEDQQAVDQHDRRAIVRIIVYGPAAAGKTTTARALGENLGRPVETPEEEGDGTTVYFDFMEYEGGSYQGQPIRTQLITVPGHDKARRVPMLTIADVILFVADTTQAGIEETVELFAEMIEELEEIDAHPAVIVQANKRDDATALPIETIRSRLDLSESDPLVETIASESEGVRVAFVLAMRHGVRRLGERENEIDTAPVDQTELLDLLRSVESSAAPVDASSGLRRRSSDGSATPATPAITEQPEPATIVEPVEPVVAPPVRKIAVPAMLTPKIDPAFTPATLDETPPAPAVTAIAEPPTQRNPSIVEMAERVQAVIEAPMTAPIKPAAETPPPPPPAPEPVAAEKPNSFVRRLFSRT